MYYIVKFALIVLVPTYSTMDDDDDDDEDGRPFCSGMYVCPYLRMYIPIYLYIYCAVCDRYILVCILIYGSHPDDNHLLITAFNIKKIITVLDRRSMGSFIIQVP